MISSTLEGILSSSNSYSVRLPYFRVGIGILTCTSFKCWQMPVDLESVSLAARTWVVRFLDQVFYQHCAENNV
jgi:hypothetical protein